MFKKIWCKNIPVFLWDRIFNTILAIKVCIKKYMSRLNFPTPKIRLKLG